VEHGQKIGISSAVEGASQTEPPLTSPARYVSEVLGLSLSRYQDCHGGLCLLTPHKGLQKLLEKSMTGDLLEPEKERKLGLSLKKNSRGIQGIALLPVGAPAAVARFEEIHVLGFKRFVYLGLCGGLSSRLKPGDLLLVNRAFSEEGTSKLYLGEEHPYFDPDIKLTESLKLTLEEANLEFHYGPCWTTDAPYRETARKIAFYRSLGALGVEMESSALFALGQSLGVSVSALHFVSDLLTEKAWNPAFGSKSLKQKIRRISKLIGEAML